MATGPQWLIKEGKNEAVPYPTFARCKFGNRQVETVQRAAENPIALAGKRGFCVFEKTLAAEEVYKVLGGSKV